MASIGQELKRERELRGISLKEIAESTKINLRFLRALEEDRLDMLPEKFFTRGIIRTYANYLGLDEQSALNTYIENLQTKETQETRTTDKKIEADEPPESTPKIKKIPLLFSLLALVIIALFIVLYFLFWKDKNPPAKTAITQPAVQETQEKTIPQPPLEKKEPESQPQELNIEISVQQETWMEIYADQEMVDSGVKNPGDRIQFRALREFLIHLGNAGGITYTLNGQEGKIFGEPGTVRRDIQITLDNFKDFITEEEES
jgi:cytoskeletal protein RodZ